MTIHDLPKYERPRERLYSLGSASLSLPELLEIILAQGSTKGSVFNIAHSLLSRFSSLAALSGASLKDIQEIKGIGYAKAAQIKAALELGRRFGMEQLDVKSGNIFNPLQAYKISRLYLKDKKKEHLLLFCLDARSRLISEPEIVSVGTLDSSLIHPREVFDIAIKNYSARIMLAHNHPSGSSAPSEPDIHVTRQIWEAGNIIGIELLDHIVVAADEFSSIRELNPGVFS